LEAEFAQIEHEVETLRSVREDSMERQVLDGEVTELERNLVTMKRGSAICEKMNPEAVKLANCWTDKIFTIKALICIHRISRALITFCKDSIDRIG
jgi:hypothetical protein